MRYFDSHCHLQFDIFDGKREQIINELIENNSKVINVGSSIENSELSINLSKKYSNNLYSSIGVHPFHSLGFEIYKDNEENKKNITYPQNLEHLESLVKNKEVKAIGECGVDFSYFKDLNGNDNDILNWKQTQIDCFKYQINLAQKYSLPLILHIRKEYILALEVLKEMQFDGKAVFHFFKGKHSDYKEISKNNNYYFGFSNVITYDDTMNKIIEEISLDKVLIETDAPYVSPLFKKEEINEPQNVIYVAEKIVKIKKVSIDNVLNITYNNAIKFFDI